MYISFGRAKQADPSAQWFVQRHFRPVLASGLITTVRTFPATARVDLQRAVDEVFHTTCPGCERIGLHASYNHETLTFSHLVEKGPYQVSVGPLQFDEVDVGETEPARCLKNALWVGREGRLPFAFLLTSHVQYGVHGGVHTEIAVPAGREGEQFSRHLLRHVEQCVHQAGTYRGKVISLDTLDHYGGYVQGIRVHRLEPVTREQIVLPRGTLGLLERNVTQFAALRPQLAEIGMPLKKGLLFYGPPGTGKTFTIRLIAGLLPDHATLLITAEQVGYLDKYMQLARFLQPAIVAIEDVDLIARERTNMRNACEESLLNKLLNEMDGLREDAQLMFILTSNRPEYLEAALTSRPGRIDQAIEFPLPDEESRRKLVRLYGGNLEWSEELVATVVAKTDKASPAFIKELIRRASQCMLARGQKRQIAMQDVQAALEEMLFTGGSLNLRLFGQNNAGTCPSGD